MRFGRLLLLALLLFSAPAWACGTAAVKLFTAITKSTVTGLTTAGTLSSVSSTLTNITTAKTAKTTATWFQFVEGAGSSLSVAGDSTTANAKGWNNDTLAIPAGCSIPAGTWTASSDIGDSSGAQTNSTLSIHIYTCVLAVCTNQCNFTGLASTSTVVAVKTVTGSCPQIDFVTNTALYMEAYWQTGSSNTSSSTTATTNFDERGPNDFISFPQDITTPAGGCARSIALLGVGCR